MFEKVPAFFLYVYYPIQRSTGPFKTREEAEGKAKETKVFQDVFDIEEYEAEKLPDGRLIVGDSVFPKFLGEG